MIVWSMSLNNSIENSRLPDDRNFSVLKDLGVDYIQRRSGGSWTNYNDSDPGITILDQLCYALTELGYCIDFPIEDIITKKDGKIDYENQFFLPEKILTTSPVTISDYCLMVADKVSEVKAIYIDPVISLSGKMTGCCQSYLSLRSGLSPKEQKSIIKDVYVLLNKSRNLTEIFSAPKLLSDCNIALQGVVNLDDGADKDDVYSEINVLLGQYVVPPIVGKAFSELKQGGLKSGQIFNGPELSGGWVSDSDRFSIKKKQVCINELSKIISAIEGVKSIDSLDMQIVTSGDDKRAGGDVAAKAVGSNTSIDIAVDEIANIHLSVDNFVLKQNELRVSNVSSGPVGVSLKKLQAPSSFSKIGSKVNVSPAKTMGKYRNISEYYSVQNTFPASYGIGMEADQFSVSSYRTAQTRQLKGYLMVFDQLIANEFSQLSHISDLFSFDIQQEFIESDINKKDRLPQQIFSPTYYCQTLYDIPNVKPLLLGSDSYHFHIKSGERVAQDESEWQSYISDPFNEYIYNLRRSMETDQSSDDRHNRMLNHLLARHGEPADIYDQLITTAQWYGSQLKTKVIIKSILLKNYQSLSYNRLRAYSFLSAQLMGSVGRYRISWQRYREMSEQNWSEAVIKAVYPCVNQGKSSFDELESLIDTAVKGLLTTSDIHRLSMAIIVDGNNIAGSYIAGSYNAGDYIDGLINQSSLSHSLKIPDADFNNFSAYEIKLNLIFGLKSIYRGLIKLLVALINNPEFNRWVEAGSTASFSLPETDLLVTAIEGSHILSDSHQQLMTIPLDASTACIELYQSYIDQMQWLSNERKGFVMIETLLLAKAMKIFGRLIGTKPDAEKSDTEGQYYLNSILIFPDYISLFQQDEFKRKIQLMEQHHWPVHVVNQFKCVSHDYLKTLIPDYIALHKQLAFNAINESTDAAERINKQLFSGSEADL